MSDAEEIDDLIVRVLMASAHGRAWMESCRERSAFLDRFRDVQRLGLSTKACAALYAWGSVEMLEEVRALSAREIAALNGAIAA